MIWKKIKFMAIIKNRHQNCQCTSKYIKLEKTSMQLYILIRLLQQDLLLQKKKLKELKVLGLLKINLFLL